MAQLRLALILSRVPACLACMFAMFVASGCESEGYPAHLVYPQRTDHLVDRARLPERDAPRYDRPGEYPDQVFVGIDAADLDKHVLRVSKIKEADLEALDQEVTRLFGTPAVPTVNGISEAARKELGLQEAVLQHGSALYRHQCLHCHGLTGDGRGPTAPWVNPHPRDYRSGYFKFTSVGVDEGRRRAHRDDLLRTLRQGVEGTSMPSFRLLTDDELDALVSYVIHLSIRGETEFTVMRRLLQGADEEDSVQDAVSSTLKRIVGYWQEANTAKNVIQPENAPVLNPEDPRFRESVLRGFDLFVREKPEGNKKSAGCLGCHTDFGRRSSYKYDYWGNVVRPADLTTGIYRGGRRPIDLYWRIHSGVNGVTMPKSFGNLDDKDIWDLVNFLRILPYPKMLAQAGIKLEGTAE